MKYIFLVLLVSAVYCTSTLVLKDKILSGEKIYMHDLFTSPEISLPPLPVDIYLKEGFNSFLKQDILHYCRKAYPKITDFTIEGHKIIIFRNRDYSTESFKAEKIIPEKNAALYAFEVEKKVVVKKAKVSKWFILHNTGPDARSFPKNTPVTIIMSKNSVSIEIEGVLLRAAKPGEYANIKIKGTDKVLKEFLSVDAIQFN
ncbi:hypothetical protein ACFL6D_00675 [Spirochaetota bacterium]